MTKKEKELIIEAIKYLEHDECLYMNAMEILCKLVGYKYPLAEEMRNPNRKTVNLRDLMKL